MLKNKKILIVEDEASLLAVLKQKLSEIGAEIMIAQDGEYGLGLAFAKHPDLILLDIIMPKTDGLTFLKRLRSDDWGKKAKVIVLTNLSDEKTSLEAAKEGVAEFLIKTDLPLSELVKKIEGHLAE